MSEQKSQSQHNTPRKDQSQQKTPRKDSKKKEIRLPYDPQVLHPLKYKWTLWYDVPDKTSKVWATNMKAVITVSSVEDFWRMYNNIARPTELLDRGSSIYNFFKEGITPTWEDPANTKGGRWSFQIKEKGNLDKMWCYLLLAAVGEQLEPEDSNLVCGCVFNVKKVHGKNTREKTEVIRLSLWCRNHEGNEERIKQIGIAMKKGLELEDEEKIEYNSHEEGLKKTLFTA